MNKAKHFISRVLTEFFLSVSNRRYRELDRQKMSNRVPRLFPGVQHHLLVRSALRELVEQFAGLVFKKLSTLTCTFAILVLNLIRFLFISPFIS